MHKNTLLFALIAVFVPASLAGCVAGSGSDLGEKEAYVPEDVTTEDDSADVFTRRTTILGGLEKANNFTAYGNFPSGTYAGYLFTGKSGEEITIDASSLEADTVAILYGPQRGSGFRWARAIAWNDDAPGLGTNSRLTRELTADGTYLIVVLDYWGRSGSPYRLSVTGTGNIFCDPAGSDCPRGSECELPSCGPTERCAPICEPINPATACEVDSDCGLINPSCCCFNSTAVNQDYSEILTPMCADDVICPAFCPAPDFGATASCVENRCEVTPSVEEPPCRPSGCSGQVCADEDVITTCEYRPEYACYSDATCERQGDGECGWTETPELTECLEGPADCRSTGCGEGQYCSFCWTLFQCIPEGAVC